MAARVPHTYRRNGTYYIRLKWPPMARKHVPQLGYEFNHSLKTHDQQVARRLAYGCAAQFQQLIDFIDRCVVSGTIGGLRNHYDEMVSALKGTISHDTRKVPHMSDSPEFDFDIDNQVFIDFDPETGMPRVKSDLKDKEANQFEIIDTLKKMGIDLSGGYMRPVESGPTVKEVADKLVKEKRVTGDWKATKTYSQGVSRLTEIVGMLGPEKIFATLTRKDVLNIRDVLMSRIDPDRSRRSKRDGMMSADTARSYFQHCTALVKYAFVQDLISSDFSAGLSIKVSDDSSDSYRPFDKDDLYKIVNGSIYHSTELKTQRKLVDSYFWAPLLAMFTGGRVNEICQLRLRDIRSELPEERDESSEEAIEPIWFIDISDDDAGQSTKTEDSKRRVPIHNQLLNIGFLEYYQQRCAVTHMKDTLFPDMKHCPSNGWGRETSRWFNGESVVDGYLDAVKLEYRENKTFHSFRHTAARKLRNRGVDEADIAVTVGHTHGTTTSRYGAGYTLERLKEIIDKLDYGLDLSHISFEKFEQYKICKGRPEKNKHLLLAKKK